jgi:hypothetical protein
MAYIRGVAIMHGQRITVEAAGSHDVVREALQKFLRDIRDAAGALRRPYALDKRPDIYAPASRSDWESREDRARETEHVPE